MLETTYFVVLLIFEVLAAIVLFAAGKKLDGWKSGLAYFMAIMSSISALIMALIVLAALFGFGG